MRAPRESWISLSTCKRETSRPKCVFEKLWDATVTRSLLATNFSTSLRPKNLVPPITKIFLTQRLPSRFHGMEKGKASSYVLQNRLYHPIAVLLCHLTVKRENDILAHRALAIQQRNPNSLWPCTVARFFVSAHNASTSIDFL